VTANNATERKALEKQIEQTFQRFTWLGRQHFAKQAKAFGLNSPQYFVLVMISRHGPAVTMGEIADLL